MKHSLFSNIIFVYKASFKYKPRIIFFLIMNFLSELLTPIANTMIVTLVVFSLTNAVNINQYLLIITGVTLVAFVLASVRYWSFLRYTFDNTFVRNSVFWVDFAYLQLTTDYMNIEPKEKRNIIQKAYSSLGGNFVGIELLLKSTPVMIINLVGMITYGVLIAFYSPIVLGILVVMTIVNFLLTKRANLYIHNNQEESGNISTQLHYLSHDLTNPNYGKDIRLYGLKHWLKTQFDELIVKRLTLAKNTERKFLLSNSSNTIFLFIRDIVAYTILISLAVSGSIDLATFTFLTGIVTGFSHWLNRFIESSNNARKSSVAVSHYRNCVAMESENEENEKKDPLSIEAPYTIEFRNVTFTYPEATSPTLEDLSFTLDAGSKVALVGNNGAGKTTIVKLLSGLYTPDSGQILINGIDVSTVDKQSYMDLFSVVFQDSEPLSLTIKHNIVCSKFENANDLKMWESLTLAGLDEKVDSLENKEHTFITQMFDKNGVRLSGGECQKLMLARALYKDSPILILDEPTASLDPLAEEEMYVKYNDLTRGNTSLFISHRLSSTQFCDNILFLDNGVIIEQGTHEELLNLGGEYSELFTIQSKYYKEDQSYEIKDQY